MEVLVPPAGVQKISVRFACSSLCGYELDAILSSTVPLVWAESPPIAEMVHVRGNDAASICINNHGIFERAEQGRMPQGGCA